jgi:hypothetical protein
MGLRAFTSELLCEQVVGRGLQRTSYELKKTHLWSFSTNCWTSYSADC